MSNYEGLFIIDPDLGLEAVKGVHETIAELIKKQGGSLSDVQEWGKRRLAYLLKRKKEGIYVMIHFAMDPASLQRLQYQLRLNERLLKFMITVVNTESLKKQEANPV